MGFRRSEELLRSHVPHEFPFHPAPNPVALSLSFLEILQSFSNRRKLGLQSLIQVVTMQPGGDTIKLGPEHNLGGLVLASFGSAEFSIEFHDPAQLPRKPELRMTD